MQYNIQVHKIGLLQTGATHFLENMENCRHIFEAKRDDVGFDLHTRLILQHPFIMYGMEECSEFAFVATVCRECIFIIR